MKISLNNIGKINNAEIKIDGITIIAGQNNTGKSTVGKSLYSIFNSFYNYTYTIAQDKISSIFSLLANELDIANIDVYDEFDKILIKEINNPNNLIICLVDYIRDCMDNDIELSTNTINLDDLVKKIEERLYLNSDVILKNTINRQFTSTFNGSINNAYITEVGSISLAVQSSKIDINISNDSVYAINSKINLKSKAIYIDNPFVIDKLQIRPIRRVSSSLDMDLYDFLTDESKVENVDEILTKQKLENIFKKINNVSKFKLIKRTTHSYSVSLDDSDNVLPISNVSTGIKTFLIIKTLLSNGSIKENGTIILDEPEVHLHPEWQLAFAEIIVLLHKEFNLHVLLTTHSPYFLNAIETFSKLYEIENKCNYYLARNEGNVSFIDDVTNDTEQIYKLLHKPFQTLLDLEYANE